MSKQQDTYELLQKVSLVLLVFGILALGASYAYRPLGFEEPKWSEDEQDRFAKAAHDYHKLGHRTDPKENEPDYDEKLRIAKAEYEKQHQLLMNARTRGDMTVRGLFYGGLVLAGLGVLGTLAAKNGE